MIASVASLVMIAAVSHGAFSIPVDEFADVFLVDADGDGVGDVAVLDGFSLTVYPTANRDAPLSLTLPPNARAMDVVRDPATGKPVVLAVCGQEVRQFGVGSGGNPAGEPLFEHTSYLAEGDKPYRFVLVFDRDGESLFFLPSSDAIELRTWTGELKERIEPSEDAPRSRFEKVHGAPGLGLGVIPDADLEFFAYLRAGNEPPFMANQRDDEPEGKLFDIWLEFYDLDVFDEAPDQWPWFALQPAAENSPRVRCAIRTTPGETHIRMDTTLSDNGNIGPARKYPGMITRLNAELPDFNGDGYTDLLLWNTDRPSVSVSTIARLAVQQDWPIRLTAHLFDPETGRYTAKPFAALDVRAAWEMLLRGDYRAPLAHCVVQDIDANGRTDVAFTVDAHTYIRWMMDADAPYTLELNLDERIQDLSFAQSLDDSGRVTIGLRTQYALYVIDPE